MRNLRLTFRFIYNQDNFCGGVIEWNFFKQKTRDEVIYTRLVVCQVAKDPSFVKDDAVDTEINVSYLVVKIVLYLRSSSCTL